MFVGYTRVSTAAQHLDMQLSALQNAGCERIFKDVASGAKAERTGLEEALAFLREHDTLVVWKLDRLGRSIRHLINIITCLNTRKIGFKSLQENIDTTTSGGKLIFHVFSALAEFEADVIRERTLAGLQAARARGRQGGRPKTLDEKKTQLLRMMNKDPAYSIQEICQTLAISRSTFYRYRNAD